MRILLDIDGVLADFVGGAIKAHGWTWRQVVALWPVGSYDVAEPMGLTVEEFWEPIDAMGKRFWQELEETPWCHQLIDIVSGLTDDWYLVSTPSLASCSYSGKADWVKAHIGSVHERLVLVASKPLLANPTTVLIDDCDESLQGFRRAGGIPLTFPSRHNALHSFVNNPMEYVSRGLARIGWFGSRVLRNGCRDV